MKARVERLGLALLEWLWQRLVCKCTHAMGYGTHGQCGKQRLPWMELEKRRGAW